MYHVVYSRLDVVDLERARILASVDRSELFYGFLGDSLLEARFDLNGTPRVGIWTASLVH